MSIPVSVLKIPLLMALRCPHCKAELVDYVVIPPEYLLATAADPVRLHGSEVLGYLEGLHVKMTEHIQAEHPNAGSLA